MAGDGLIEIIPDEWQGRVLEGRFRIEAPIKTSATAMRFAAHDLAEDRPATIELVRADFAAGSDAEARFVREALRSATLVHPHVVRTHAFGHASAEWAYLASDPVRGESLAERLRRGPLPVAKVCELGAQVADALAAAHAVGLFHRDLRPENIVLERRDDGGVHVKVAGFGAQRKILKSGKFIVSDPVLEDGVIGGVLAYGAFEQLIGLNEPNIRTDLCVLGIILFECTAGRPPWEDVRQFVTLLRGGSPKLANMASSPLPAPFQVLLDRLLAVDPAERPASAAEVREALRQITAASTGRRSTVVVLVVAALLATITALGWFLSTAR